MPRAKKSWADKLNDDKGLPRVAKIEGRMKGRWGEGTVVIPAPREVDALMAAVPRGKLTTIDELRRALARKHLATIGCPITTGIFAWIAAHASAEAAAAGRGRRRTTPYWRTLKSGGELNAKYPGGISGLTTKLRGEGHRVIQKGHRHLVADFEKSLERFEGISTSDIGPH